MAVNKLKWAWFDYRTDIPQWAVRGIGQIAVEWSVLERELEELIRLLMDIDIQPARIITNKMNARTRVFTATNLSQAHVYNDRLIYNIMSDFAKLGTKIVEAIQDKRDMVAHGLWTKHEGDWCVLKLRANRKTPELAPDLTKLSRAVLPQREVVTAERLQSIAHEIVGAAQEVETLCERVQGALAPLRSTRPQYTRRRRNYQKQRKGTAQTSRPRSSRT